MCVVNTLSKIKGVGRDWCINFPSHISFDVRLRGSEALIFFTEVQKYVNDVSWDLLSVL